MKFVLKISYPPANGASLCLNLDVFEAKTCHENSSGSQTCKLFFKWFYVLVRWKIKYLGSKFVTDRQIDRQTNSLIPYTGVCGFFVLVKFFTSLLASLAVGILGNDIPKPTQARWHIGMPSPSYWDPWQILGSNPGLGEYCFHLRLIA